MSTPLVGEEAAERGAWFPLTVDTARIRAQPVLTNGRCNDGPVDNTFPGRSHTGASIHLSTHPPLVDLRFDRSQCWREMGRVEAVYEWRYVALSFAMAVLGALTAGMWGIRCSGWYVGGDEVRRRWSEVIGLDGHGCQRHATF